MIPAPFVSSVISSRSAALVCKAATAFSMSATGKRATTVTLMTATSFDWWTTSAKEVRPSYDVSVAPAQDAESGIAVSPDRDFDAVGQGSTEDNNGLTPTLGSASARQRIVTRAASLLPWTKPARAEGIRVAGSI